VQPELALRPILRAEVLSDRTESDSASASQAVWHLVRRLHGRRPDLDAPLDEVVACWQRQTPDGTDVAFQWRPVGQDPLPHYYPPVAWLAFVYSSRVTLAALVESGIWTGVPSVDLGPSHEFGDVVVAIVAVPRPSTSAPAESPWHAAAVWPLLMDTLCRWGRSTEAGYRKRTAFDTIVPRDRFEARYRQLKAAHGHWCQHWPESTDPKKFVFEELGIAAFILELWADDPEMQPGGCGAFVDLGCGNGFLTYVLSREGYRGYGVDIAARRIWSMYVAEGTGVQPDLRVAALDPSTATFPAHTWLLGNHADELVPWIPIMAARSGCRCVVLPCCLHDLGGPYTAYAPGGGRFAAYVAYIRSLATECGFAVEQQHLRIPSNKNIVLVGRSWTPERPPTAADLEARIGELLRRARFTKFEPRTSDRERGHALEDRRRRRQEALAAREPSNQNVKCTDCTGHCCAECEGSTN